MKNIIIYSALFLIPVLCMAQNKEKAGIIKKDKKGIIISVEFPPSVEKSKRPVSASVKIF